MFKATLKKPLKRTKSKANIWNVSKQELNMFVD